MLRLSTSLRAAVAAAALLTSTASWAQGGLGGRITDAGTKLDQDIQGCRPVNLGEYQQLLHEAAQNKQRADKAAKKGVPVDQAQVDADLANASALFHRAQAALVQQCMRGAQQAAQPQPQTAGAVPGGSTPAPGGTAAQPGDGAEPGTTGSRIAEAEKKLEDDIKACRPINPDEYKALLDEASANAKAAGKAVKAGAPIDYTKVVTERSRAADLLEKARQAQQQQKACPPKKEAKEEPKPKTTGALPGRLTPAPTLAGGQSGQACATVPARSELPDPRTSIPTAKSIEQTGISMVEAYEKGRHSEAEYLRGELDQEAQSLRKVIHDAKQVGEMSNVNVGEAEKRLGEIENLRKYADKVGIRPCSDFLKPSFQAQPEQPKPQPQSTQGAMNLNPFARDILAIHNAARAAVGSPPLKWNDVLAGHAQERAVQNAQAQQLVHAPREGRGTERENIASAPDNYSTSQIINLWKKEQAHYVPGGIFPNVCDTGGDCSGVWHYSQMIWSQTTEIGCGAAPGGGYNWVVCRYNPGGNKDGKPVVGSPVQIADSETLDKSIARGHGPQIHYLDCKNWRSLKMDPKYFEKLGRELEAQYARECPAPLPTIPSSASAQIVLDHDYGYDAALFVGYDLGAFRIEAEVAYKRAEADLDAIYVLPAYSNSSAPFAFGVNFGVGLLEAMAGYTYYDPATCPVYWDPVNQVTLGVGATYNDFPVAEPNYVDTKVEQPNLPPAEVFDPAAPPPSNLSDCVM